MTTPVGLRVTVRRGQCPGQGELLLRHDKALVSLPGLDLPQWLPRDQVPALLARVCGLAPRPMAGRTAALVTERSTVDRLLAAGGDLDEAAVRQCLHPGRPSDDWVRRLRVAASHVESHWEVTVLSADGTTAPWLEVIDAGRIGGLWSVKPASPQLLAAADDRDGTERLVALARVTTTTIWAALSTCATATTDVEPD